MMLETLEGLNAFTEDVVDLDDYLQETERMATERNQHIHRPRQNELYIDIDSEAQLTHCHKVILLFKRFGYQVHVVRDTPSRSDRKNRPAGNGGPRRETHRHVVIDMGRPLHPKERMLLQAAFGSDPMREALGWLRYEKEKTDPTVLFEDYPPEPVWEVIEHE